MRYGGRTQGTPNKTTKELRQRIEAITEGLFNELQIHELTNKEKIDLLTKLLPYVTPKLQAHQINQNQEHFKTLYINEID
jgi:hypothetical protein